MFYQIFVSPKVKRKVIISNEHVIYELPNDLRLRKENLKTLRDYKLVPSLSPKKKILSILAKDSLRIEIELFP